MALNGREGGTMASEWAIEKAAQVWCRPEVEHKEMDVELAMAFAEVLDEQNHANSTAR